MCAREKRWTGSPAGNDARPQRIGSPAAHDDGVDVHLHDLGKVRDEVGEVHDDLLQLPEVRRGLAAVPLEHPEDPGVFHEPARQGLVQRRQGQGKVTVDPDAHPSHPEENDGPEGFVFPGSRITRSHGWISSGP